MDGYSELGYWIQRGASAAKVFCVISIAPKYRFNPFGMRSTGLLQYSGASVIHGSQVYISSQQIIIIGFLVVYLSQFIV